MKSRRFTLLELMIAVSIFTLVAVGLFMYSSNAIHTWERLTEERDRFSELLVLDRAVDNVLSNAVPFMWRDTSEDVTEELPFVLAQPDLLRIAYMHKLNDAEEGALRFVEFSVQNGELLATYAERPFVNWDEIAEERRKVSVLATGVASISFMYADWSSDVSEDWQDRLFWRDEWETEDSGRADIPLAVLMTVTWEDGRCESWFRRTMGNSYRERYGTYNLPTDNVP